MKLHPRHKKTTEAYHEATLWLNDWEHRHKLTSAEVVELLASYLSSLAKYEIRTERGK